MEGSNNVIFENKITGNWFMGINLCGSSNFIFDNYIANNIDSVHEKNGFGISLGGANNNTFYRNTLINNSYNFRILEPSYINYWDNGLEGNFWDGYNGSDNNGDGIGDTSYIIDENNQDNYPIMNYATIPEFPSWAILPLFLTLVFVVTIYKKRLN
jgi:parallel beta-helix repeat protein